MTDASTLLIILLLIVAFPYVGGPLLVLLTFKYRIPANIVFFDEAELTLPQHVRNYFDPVRETLESKGFQPVAHFCLPELVNNAKSISVLFSNPEDLEGALVNCIYSETLGQHALADAHVEFATRFRDGVSVQTNNSRQLSAFLQPTDEHTIQFSGEQDVAEIHRRHSLICEQLSSAAREFRLAEEFQNDVEQYLQSAVLKEPVEYQVSLGLFRQVSGGYRPTLKGAFRLTWQELWPWKFLRKQRRRHEAQRWLTIIGA